MRDATASSPIATGQRKARPEAMALALAARSFYRARSNSFGRGLNGGFFLLEEQDPIKSGLPCSRSLQDCFDAFPGFEGAPRQALLVETERKAHFMALYEHIFLARQDVSQQQVEELTAQLTEILSQGGGKVTKNEYWGLKGLSYRIRKNRKAHYTLLNIDASAPAVAEMERQMRINEDVLRFMTVRVDELEEGPSAMMQKRDRDDRDGGGRGDRGGPSGDRRPRRF